MSAATPSHAHASWLEVLIAFSTLGLTCFGGPVAHLGFFRDEFVARRRWLDERAYADLVALCQFLPGPASSQVGMSIGMLRAGLPGALAAWVGFTAPSAALMVGFAYGVNAWQGLLQGGALHGLKVVTVAVVAQAVWAMGRTLCTDRVRVALAALTALVCLAYPGSIVQLIVLALAGLVGWLFLGRDAAASTDDALSQAASGRGRDHALAATGWAGYFALLLVLPLAAQASGASPLALFDAFYRAGALVFGGGHVVLPLLEAEVVPRGWISRDAFLAGYGAAQAVPGPLFSFAGYLGAAMHAGPGGWAGGVLCLVAIFLPGFLLVLGALPYWQRIRGNRGVRAALAGVNAAVVGLLLAALYDPVAVGAIAGPLDIALALVAFGFLARGVRPWLVVALSAGASALLVVF